MFSGGECLCATVRRCVPLLSLFVLFLFFLSSSSALSRRKRHTNTRLLRHVVKKKRMAARDFFSITDPAQKEQAKLMISKLQSKILYSDKYYDDEYEYRHVILPKDFSRLVPRGRLMEESEWRQLGVQQSIGWRHYMFHKPEPHVLLFKRPKTQ